LLDFEFLAINTPMKIITVAPICTAHDLLTAAKRKTSQKRHGFMSPLREYFHFLFYAFLVTHRSSKHTA